MFRSLSRTDVYVGQRSLVDNTTRGDNCGGRMEERHKINPACDFFLRKNTNVNTQKYWKDFLPKEENFAARERLLLLLPR